MQISRNVKNSCRNEARIFVVELSAKTYLLFPIETSRYALVAQSRSFHHGASELVGTGSSLVAALISAYFRGDVACLPAVKNF